MIEKSWIIVFLPHNLPRVFYISLMFSNASHVLSQCNTWLKLLYLLNIYIILIYLYKLYIFLAMKSVTCAVVNEA